MTEQVEQSGEVDMVLRMSGILYWNHITIRQSMFRRLLNIFNSLRRVMVTSWHVECGKMEGEVEMMFGMARVININFFALRCQVFFLRLVLSSREPYREMKEVVRMTTIVNFNFLSAGQDVLLGVVKEVQRMFRIMLINFFSVGKNMFLGVVEMVVRMLRELYPNLLTIRCHVLLWVFEMESREAQREVEVEVGMS